MLEIYCLWISCEFNNQTYSTQTKQYGKGSQIDIIFDYLPKVYNKEANKLIADINFIVRKDKEL